MAAGCRYVAGKTLLVLYCLKVSIAAAAAAAVTPFLSGLKPPLPEALTVRVHSTEQ